MHIAYVHQHFSTPRGATGTRSYEMSRRLIRRGHRVTMICGAYAAADVGGGAGDQNRHAAEITEEIDGITVRRLGAPYADQMSFVERVRVFMRFARAAGRLVCRLKPDLVLASSTPLTVGLVGVRAKRRLGVPFVFEVRDLWPEVPIAMGALRNPLLRWYARRMESRIYAAADRVIALSPGMGEGVCRRGYPRERVAIIPNACDLDLFRPGGDIPIDDSRFGTPDTCRFVFAGAHGLVGGLDGILDAVGELKRRGESGVRVIFIGQGRERDRLIERSRREGLDPWVSWIGSMSKAELARVMPAMDVGIMTVRNVPALFAASPNKFFDYIASGLPVLMNYPGWLADLVREYACGIVTPPDDAVAFADAMVRLRDDADLRNEMGSRARRLAEERFSRDELGEQFVRVLEDAYEEGGSRRHRPAGVGVDAEEGAGV